MKFKAIFLVLLAFVLVGCSAIHEGSITQKEHHEGYYYSVLHCAFYNSKGICASYIPIQQYQPPTWRFDIQSSDKHGYVYVSQDTYGRYDVGDYYKNPNN